MIIREKTVYSMKKWLITWIVATACLWSAGAGAQQENVWVFGENAGLDFNSGAPVAVPTGMDVSTEASASVCDANGDLLFYTNGYKVWSSNHSLMPNGNGLITDPVLPPLGPTAPAPNYTSSTSQGALIVPRPDHAGQYYIFSMTSAEFGITTSGVGRLYCSVVDMSLNGGWGDIVPGQKGVLIDSGLTEHMTGVVGDRCNVWLLVISRLQNQLKAYSITATGIDPTPVLSPLLPINNFATLGCMDVSPNRKKLAIGRFGFGLYDFDPATGMASGGMQVMGSLPATTAYSPCFSPDNTKLYISYVPVTLGTYYSYQLDLSSGNPAIIPGTATSLLPVSYSFKRAPNGLIYAAGESSVDLHVIQSPNLPGAACQYTPDAISLSPGATHRFGLPTVVPVFIRDTLYSSALSKPPCFASSFTIHALNDTTGWDYLWSDGTTGPSLVVDTPGTYWVSYHAPPCRDRTDTFHVRFGSRLPQLEAAAGCKSSNSALVRAKPAPGDTATYTFTWWDAAGLVLRGPLNSNAGDSLTGINAGNYELAISAPDGCDTVLVAAVPEPVYEASFTADSIVCAGDVLTFDNTSTGGFNTYQWSFGDGNTSPLEDPTHSYTTAGLYTVILVAQTPFPCRDTTHLRIAVDSPYTATFTTDRDSICAGAAIVFTPRTDSSMRELLWSFGDGSSVTTTPGPLQHAYDNDGAAEVSLTALFRACPESSYRDTVHVLPFPVVDLGTDQEICLNGQPVVLTNRIPPSAGDRYQWNSGDTTHSFTVRHHGRYSLTVSNAFGCRTTDSVDVLKSCYIDIPNAFTPNGDGVNDYFFPRQLLSKKLSRFRMQVFNRWGQLIFETDKTDGRGWDGRYNNTDQPQGVYVYLIEAIIAGERQEWYQGNVTLMR